VRAIVPGWLNFYTTNARSTSNARCSSSRTSLRASPTRSSHDRRRPRPVRTRATRGELAAAADQAHGKESDGDVSSEHVTSSMKKRA
jgi:hypothetical protein